MHKRTVTDLTTDEDGYERPSLDHMRWEAIWAAREMIAADALKGRKPAPGSVFEITDEGGAKLLNVRFEDVLDGLDAPEEIARGRQRHTW